MTDIFNKLTEADLTPNTYYVLYCIKENIIPASFVNKDLECKRLQTGGWLKDNLQLTTKSFIFIQEINSFFKKTKPKTATDLMGSNFSDKIKEYLEIFPNRKLPSGKYARVNPKNLEAGFKWFFENYDYDWNTILKATEKYVDEFSVRNYEYMRNSQYFIRKQGVDKSLESDLATYCDLLKSNPDGEGTSYFKERVV
jgi:hypothetical protein